MGEDFPGFLRRHLVIALQHQVVGQGFLIKRLDTVNEDVSIGIAGKRIDKRILTYHQEKDYKKVLGDHSLHQAIANICDVHIALLKNQGA